MLNDLVEWLGHRDSASVFRICSMLCFYDEVETNNPRYVRQALRTMGGSLGGGLSQAPGIFGSNHAEAALSLIK